MYGMLARVPKGKVTTYGELARAAGLRNGQRAVGRIMNRNPYPSIIPCHRVVMSTGDVGGYAYGTEVKEEMLAREGVALGGGRISDMDGTMYRFG
ncbi:MAG: MGMT family protein [Thaumarchaeota archaeon]|nr:MGMT family protein [Nitrososphaerota archaeon]MDE0265849.1 MGMT family protein [Nitrososphaerota archaeon]